MVSPEVSASLGVLDKSITPQVWVEEAAIETVPLPALCTSSVGRIFIVFIIKRVHIPF